jgi:UDP-galactopyranose mutase
MQADWLIVGAGLTGLTLAERIANELGESVILIDRRDHIAGNAYDHVDAHGQMIHPYGPHIFHTNSEKVWRHLSQFTQWRPYEHQVQASIDGRMVPIPFNFASIRALFAPAMANAMMAALVACFGQDARVPILKLRESDDPVLRQLADYVYDKVFLNYTIKQWGMRPEELDAGVSGRVPVVVGEDCRYFTDTYQAMPRDGFTAMAQNMLRSPKIKLLLGTEFTDIKPLADVRRVIFTGPIDEYFDHSLGALPYRSLRFEFWNETRDQLQDVAVYNYPNDFDFTRITEFKHLTGSQQPGSTLVREYPQPHVPGETIAYYPIPTAQNRALYRAYAAKARAVKDRVLFAGRLGDYSYYNMDQAVAGALALFEKEIRHAELALDR